MQQQQLDAPEVLVTGLRRAVMDTDLRTPWAVGEAVVRRALSARTPAMMPPWAALLTHAPDSALSGCRREHAEFGAPSGWILWYLDRSFVAASVVDFVCDAGRASRAFAAHVHSEVGGARFGPPDCISDFVRDRQGATPDMGAIAGVLAYLPLIDGSTFATFDSRTGACITADAMRSIVDYFTRGRGPHAKQIAAYFDGPLAPFARGIEYDPNRQAPGSVSLEEAYISADPLMAAVLAMLLGCSRREDDVRTVIMRLVLILRLDRSGLAHEHLLLALASLRSSTWHAFYVRVLDGLLLTTQYVASTAENDRILVGLWYACARSTMSGLYGAYGDAPVDVRYTLEVLEKRFARTPSAVGWSGIDILWGLSSPSGLEGHPDEAHALARALAFHARTPAARRRTQAVRDVLAVDPLEIVDSSGVIIAPCSSLHAVIWGERDDIEETPQHAALRFVDAIYPMLALVAMGVRRTRPIDAVVELSPLSAFLNSGGWYAAASRQSRLKCVIFGLRSYVIS